MDKILKIQTIKLQSQRIILINVYCPFDERQKQIDNLEKHFKEVCNKWPHFHIVVVGDFNSNPLNPDTWYRLDDLMTFNGLLQQVTIPARVTSNSSSI